MTLGVHRERTREGFVVSLVGDLDRAMAGAATRAITATSEPSVVVDLSDLNSLDGSGLLALVEASHHLACAGQELRIIGASGEVMTAIRSSTLERFISDTGSPATPR
jgi:anti-anti-sigma factor